MNIRIDFLAPTKSVARTSNLNGEIEILSPAVSINRSFTLTAEIKSATQAYCELVADAANSMPEVIAASKKIESLLITDTASGPIASFPDGAEMPVKSLVVDIEPVQDLHRYASPWPAGGGVNKLPPMVDGTYEGNGVKAVVSGGIATLSGTTNASGNALIIPLSSPFTCPASFYLHCGNSVANASLAPSLENSQNTSQNTNYALSPVNRISGEVTGKEGQTYDRIRFYIGNGVTISGTYAPMICLDNTARSYQPYSNICPISGWTGANVYACGVNVWDEEWEPGLINASTGQDTDSTQYSRTKNYMPVLPGTNYWIHNTPSPLYLRRYDRNKNYLGYGQNSGNGVWQIPADTYYIRFCWDGQTYGNNISWNYPSTDHDYHAYTGHVYHITWADEAGTVYGGTDDVISGAGVDRMDLVDLSELTWNKDTVNEYSNMRARVVSYNTPDGGWQGDWNNTKCNCFVSVNPSTAFASIPIYSFRNIPGNYYNFNVKVPTNDFVDAAAFKTWLANIDGNNTHAVVVIDKLTNVAFSTTPITIESLYGQNNIWADTGDVEVEYYADTKLYINKIVAALA